MKLFFGVLNKVTKSRRDDTLMHASTLLCMHTHIHDHSFMNTFTSHLCALLKLMHRFKVSTWTLSPAVMEQNIVLQHATARLHIQPTVFLCIEAV